MFNIGGGELAVILLVALLVLGPHRLPEAARQVGRFANEIRRLSGAFQREIQDAIDFSTESEARDEGQRLADDPEDSADHEANPPDLDHDPALDTDTESAAGLDTDTESAAGLDTDAESAVGLDTDTDTDAESAVGPADVDPVDDFEVEANGATEADAGPSHESGTDDPSISTAAAAGMYGARGRRSSADGGELDHGARRATPDPSAASVTPDNTSNPDPTPTTSDNTSAPPDQSSVPPDETAGPTQPFEDQPNATDDALSELGDSG